MSQEDEEVQKRLLARIKAALLRLDQPGTPSNAELALLAPILESAADAVQSSRPQAAGHFLSLLHKPGTIQISEASSASTDQGQPCQAGNPDSTPLPDLTPSQPPAEAEPVAEFMVPPCTIAQLWAEHRARNMEIFAKSRSPRPPCEEQATLSDATSSQAAPPGAPGNPIGGSLRSRPY